MRDLRLIGVHEDGVHLLLADDEGTRFRVPLDEPLRTAARQHRPSFGRHGILDADAGPRPRDVQAMIRAGLSAQEVAEQCGWTVEKVHKYEVPILAEREYVAGLARLVRLRSRGSSAHPPSLAGRVTERLATRGVDPEQVSWDSRREAGSEWTVALTFPAGGRQREATWGFDPATQSVHARDDEARWLSEDDPSANGAAAAHREVPVYDIEAEGGVNAAPSEGHDATRPSDPVDLVTAMRARTSARSRRGSRRRTDDDAAQPLPDSAPAEVAEAPPVDSETDWAATQVGPSTSDAGEAGGKPETEQVGSPLTPEPDAPAPEVDEAPRVARRGARVPVPSWDEVMFGTKPNGD